MLQALCRPIASMGALHALTHALHGAAAHRHRFYKEQSSPAQIEVFMRENGLTYTPVRACCGERGTLSALHL